MNLVDRAKLFVIFVFSCVSLCATAAMLHACTEWNKTTVLVVSMIASAAIDIVFSEALEACEDAFRSILHSIIREELERKDATP